MPPIKTWDELAFSSSTRTGVYVGSSSASAPAILSERTSVLSCMQDPQNIPAPPAVMMQILMEFFPAGRSGVRWGSGCRWLLCRVLDQEYGGHGEHVLIFEGCLFQQVESSGVHAAGGKGESVGVFKA